MKPRIDKLAAIPISVRYSGVPCIWELRHNAQRYPNVGDRGSQPLCFIAHDVKIPPTKWRRGIELPGPPPTSKYLDALTLREEFMQLKTDQQFLDFLNRIGRFSPLPDAERSHGWLFNDLVFCQEMFGQLAKRSPETWNDYAQGLIGPKSPAGLVILSALNLSVSHRIQFHWKGASHGDWFGAKNLAVIETNDVISAILATIEIDHLRGAKFGCCARSDCRMFFEITSRHKRKYCSMYCAHLESVRRMRERRKRTSSKASTPSVRRRRNA